MLACPRCGLEILKDEPFVCPRCHTMFNRVGLALREVGSATEAIALLGDGDPFVRTQMRWILRGMGEPALAALVDAHAREPTDATGGALVFLGRAAREAMRARGLSTALFDVAADVVEPVPYLGEAVVFDDEPPDANDYGEALWHRIVEVDRTILEGAVGTGEAWQPDRIVLGRELITLELYSWRTGDSMTCDIVTAGDAFTMGELLFACHRAYADLAEGGPRIFEGLRATAEPGVYQLRTGS